MRPWEVHFNILFAPGLQRDTEVGWLVVETMWPDKAKRKAAETARWLYIRDGWREEEFRVQVTACHLVE